MPEVKLEIGGRVFPVVCQPGEEEQLSRAAAMLDGEAEKLQAQIGRIPETRMLLMAGLLLADRVLDAETDATAARARADALTLDLRTAEERSAGAATDADVASAQREAAAAKATLDRAAERLESVADMLEAL